MTTQQAGTQALPAVAQAQPRPELYGDRQSRRGPGLRRLTLRNDQADRLLDCAALAFCLLFLAASVFFGRLHVIGNFGVETDFYGTYAGSAEAILNGEPYTYTRNPPGYMVLLAAVYLVTGDMFSAGKLLSSVSAALFGLAAYVLLKSLFCARVALCATILMSIALFPVSFIAATDLVAALAMLLPALFLLRAREVGPATCFFVGVLAGVAYLIRYNAAFLVVGIPLVLMFFDLGQRSDSKLGRLRLAAFFLLGALLTIAPWLFINWQLHGSPFYNETYLQMGAHFFHAEGDRYGTALRESQALFGSMGDVLLHDPPAVLKKFLADVMVVNIILLFNGSLMFPVYMFTGVGLVLLAFDISSRRLSFYLLYAFGYVVLGLVGFYLRYYFFLYPLIFLAVGYTLFNRRLYDLLGVLPHTRIRTSWVLLILCCLPSAALAVREAVHVIQTDPKHLLEVAEHVREISEPDDILVVRKPHLAYIAHRPSRFPLAYTPDEYVDVLEEIDARYIVYSGEEARLWPPLEFLKDPTNVPRQFRLVLHHEPSGVLIYEFTGERGAP